MTIGKITDVRDQNPMLGNNGCSTKTTPKPEAQQNELSGKSNRAIRIEERLHDIVVSEDSFSASHTFTLFKSSASQFKNRETVHAPNTEVFKDSKHPHHDRMLRARSDTSLSKAGKRDAGRQRGLVTEVRTVE